MLHRLVLPIVAALAMTLPAVGQETEVELPGPSSTTPGTYRDPEAAAIGTAREELKTWATTKVEKLSHFNRAGTTAKIRVQQYGQQTRLVEFADDAMSRRYIQNLGRATWVADSGATIAGYVVEGNYEGAVVAAADEGAKSVSAWGGATALGELGGAVGGAFGGPPGLMIGGAVGAVSGAVLATLGYNAFISPTLSGAVNEALEPDYKELARQNREEHLQELGAAIAVILIEQDKLRKETETADAPASSPEATPSRQTPAGTETPGPEWVYQGIWLPEKYFPAGYRHYSDDKVPQGEPIQAHGSQSLWYGIPLRSKGGKASSSSGEHPYTVFIDGITVYKSVEIAKKCMQQGRENLAAKTTVALGDEAYVGDSCKGDDGSIFKEFKDQDGVCCRNINAWLVRVGRVTFGLRVSGDRVMDYTPNAANSQRFVAHPTPTREEIVRTAELFVARIRLYAKDKGWLQD